ncbi:MAG: helix-hairpin-helix domain-containing protein [Alphaproteobacteria bacterium]|nr:helix-hairpin-helix domain-containing protein [Alphaproteobacteria bacterium]MBU2271947.1 helix-hairpin-helix domain-containing protein [Alphaproteobacteria bacterium]MBU2418757.1 helix-hairpin-helix domain-containing protein [Alphaproteobacteria bacterium]
MTDARGTADTVYLNLADGDALRRLEGIDEGTARALIEARPFHDWSDLKRVEGVDQDRINALKSAGAELGEPKSGPIGEPGSGGSGGSPGGNLGQA